MYFWVYLPVTVKQIARFVGTRPNPLKPKAEPTETTWMTWMVIPEVPEPTLFAPPVSGLGSPYRSTGRKDVGMGRWGWVQPGAQESPLDQSRIGQPWHILGLDPQPLCPPARDVRNRHRPARPCGMHALLVGVPQDTETCVKSESCRL